MFATALGRAGYTAALFVIGFGVFAGFCATTAVPLIVAISAFDLGESSAVAGLSTFFGWLATSAILTFRCRNWIARKALEEAPPKAVQLWFVSEVLHGGLWVIRAALVIPLTLIAIAVVVVALYTAYLLIGALSVPIAIIIAAIIIAIAILLAASS